MSQLNLKDVGAVSAVSTRKRKEKIRIEWASNQRFDECNLPIPTVLIGEGLPLWDNVVHKVCPACRDKHLAVYEYCIFCDAYGANSLLEKNKTHIQINVFVQKKAGDGNIAEHIGSVKAVNEYT